MKIAIAGTGYMGLVTGGCFAEMGNRVASVNIDERKLQDLRNGIVPIHERGLEELVFSNTAAGRLTFTSDFSAAVNDSGLAFIAVGTPPNEDGSADLPLVHDVAKSIGQAMTHPIVVADKSTVPVGTADQMRETIDAALLSQGESIEFDVVSNPEFLREGSAVQDFMYPDRVVVGTNCQREEHVMDEHYSAFSKKTGSYSVCRCSGCRNDQLRRGCHAGSGDLVYE